jgi:hypothetical protein
MKNVFLTVLTLIGLSAFAAKAEAGGFYRVSDRCDRSGYYRPPVSYRYCEPRYERSYRTYRTYQPHYYYSSYRRPTYVTRDSCSSSRRAYYSAPRFSISFGF